MHPLLKKLSLDPIVLNNYHMGSTLQFLGKVVEGAVVVQLQALDTDAFPDTFQSGFHSGNEMETTLFTHG